MRISGGGAGALPDHDHTGTAGGGGALTDPEHDGADLFSAVATPMTTAGRAKLYGKSVAGTVKMHILDSLGVETDIAAAGGGLVDHGHTAPGDGGTLDHADLTNVTANQHHNQSHAHNGADGSGTVAHSATTGQTANDHHNQAHPFYGADHAADVAYTDTPADGDVLTYQTSDSKWHASPAGAASLTSHNHDTASASDGGKLSGAVVDTFFDFEEQGSAPSAPGSGAGRVYALDLGGRTQLYLIDSTGAMQLAQVLFGSATWDPASISGGAEVYTDVTVTGAELGDIVLGCSMDRNFLGDGLILRGHVSAADTVRVELGNFSTTSRNEASFTLRVAVLKVV